ncbi:hypothetical protein WPG_0245 [Winogradskyella sp. PG-2]|nr:hypothetical protein WPG_0245 [Winogradskyella sp. PG-2]
MLTNFGTLRLPNQRIIGRNSNAINIENINGINIKDNILSK